MLLRKALRALRVERMIQEYREGTDLRAEF
jgi:hypothetical protein